MTDIATDAVLNMRTALGDVLDISADPRKVNRDASRAWSELHDLDSPERQLGVNFVIATLSERRRQLSRWVVLRASERGSHPDFSQQPIPSIVHPVLDAPMRDGENVVIPCLMDATESNLYGFSLPLRDSEDIIIPVQQELVFTVFDRSHSTV